jgi:hypothetical protein
MANAVEKVNTIAIADIEAINTITDANLQALNTLEFTGAAVDAHTLISTHDIAVLGASASIDITSGIDSTYDVYEFVFTDMHPATSGVGFQFQVNATDGADYNDSPITSTHFQAYHNEADSDAALAYSAGNDAAQSTSYVPLLAGLANDADSNASGVLTLYAPSSTTYVKHFTSNISFNNGTYATQAVTAGYINDTTAIDEISFKMSSGNIDAGVIKMYGIAKS